MVFVLPAYSAQNRERRGRENMPLDAKAGHLAEKLDLTDEQRETIKAQREEHREKIKEMREELASSMKELHAELEKEDPDRRTIDGIVEKICELREDMLKERVNTILSLREILTAEQFAELKEMRERMRERRTGKIKQRMKDRWGDSEEVED